MSATLIRRPALWTMENRLRGGRSLLMPHLESVNLRPLIGARVYLSIAHSERNRLIEEYRYDRRLTQGVNDLEGILHELPLVIGRKSS